MAETEGIFEPVTDRTPYGACWLLALVALVIMILGVTGIWRLGTYVKRQDWFRGGAPSARGLTDTAQDAGSQTLLDAKRKAQETVDRTNGTLQDQARDALDATADQAKDAAADAAKAEAQRQIDSLQGTGGDNQ